MGKTLILAFDVRTEFIILILLIYMY